MNLLSRKSAILFFSFTLLFIFTIFSLLLVIFFLFSTSNDRSQSNPTTTFRFLKIDRSTKKSTRGLSFLPKFDEDTLFYIDEKGSYNLISKFDRTEYECTGSCFCDEKNMRRNSATPTLLTRGLVFLVAALSTHTAIQRAEDYYHDFCMQELSEECATPSSVTSEVEECSPIETDSNSIETQESESESLSLEKEDKNSVHYLCSGRCFPNNIKKYKRAFGADVIFNSFSPNDPTAPQDRKERKFFEKQWGKYIKKQGCGKLQMTKSFPASEVQKWFYNEKVTAAMEGEGVSSVEELSQDFQEAIRENEGGISSGDEKGLAMTNTYFMLVQLGPLCWSKEDTDPTNGYVFQNMCVPWSQVKPLSHDMKKYENPTIKCVVEKK